MIVSWREKLVLLGLLSLLVIIVTGFAGPRFIYNPANVKVSQPNLILRSSINKPKTVGTITLIFQTQVNLAIGSIIKLSYNSDYIGELNTQNTTINSVEPANVTNLLDGGKIISSIRISAPIQANSDIQIDISDLITPSKNGNYIFEIQSEKLDNISALQQITDDLIFKNGNN